MNEAEMRDYIAFAIAEHEKDPKSTKLDIYTEFQSMINCLKLGFDDINSKDFENSFQILQISPILMYNMMVRIPSLRNSDRLVS